MSRPPNSRHYSDSMVSPTGQPPRGAIRQPNRIPQNQGRRPPDVISPLTSPPVRSTLSSTNNSQNRDPNALSPPISRAGSTDGATALLIEDWRSFTRKLREQFAKERRHMEENRIRAEEVMAEERALWDKERACYENRISELEEHLRTISSQASSRQSPTNVPPSYFPPSHFPHSRTFSPPNVVLPRSAGTSTHPSIDSNASRSSLLTIQQENGRNPDGSRFYAPKPTSPPTRIFGPSANSILHVDNVHVPQETPITVTAKELTPADFLSPPHSHASGSSSPKHKNSDVIGDSIDVSLIQPELEGIPIKSTAVDPTFAVRVLSPSGNSMSPHRFSPDVKPPPRPVQSYDSTSPEARRRSSVQSPVSKRTVEVIKHSTERRLTMHAGHTPNHSVIHFDLGDSGLTTPKASKINHEVGNVPGNVKPVQVVRDSQSVDIDVLEDLDNGDVALTGPLGLKNEKAEDDVFLAALTLKLEEVAEKEQDAVSVTTTETDEDGNELGDEALLKQALSAIGRGINGNMDGSEDKMEDIESAKADMPILRLKPSVNFGRPLGSL